MADTDSISILDIVKRGGYEASLITSFNATLPFYEEVVLRRLVAAGARHRAGGVSLRPAPDCWGMSTGGGVPRGYGNCVTIR